MNQVRLPIEDYPEKYKEILDFWGIEPDSTYIPEEQGSEAAYMWLPSQRNIQTMPVFVCRAREKLNLNIEQFFVGWVQLGSENDPAEPPEVLADRAHVGCPNILFAIHKAVLLAPYHNLLPTDFSRDETLAFSFYHRALDKASEVSTHNPE